MALRGQSARVTDKQEIMRDDLPPATQQPDKDAADSSVWFVPRHAALVCYRYTPSIFLMIFSAH